MRAIHHPNVSGLAVINGVWLRAMVYGNEDQCRLVGPWLGEDFTFYFFVQLTVV